MPSQTRSGESFVSSPDFEADFQFFTDTLGLVAHEIFPADNPREALLVGLGLRLRLQRGHASPGHFILYQTDKSEDASAKLRSPGGSVIEWRSPVDALECPDLRPQFQLARLEDQSWTRGRAGMLYRDLIPDRQGGRFIASHIKIEEAGPVPDYVHFHNVRFQLIYCYKGWVRLLYEDQGPAFILEEGGCVLQPPQIRHRVLESSAALEVVEVSCPAEHKTYHDPDLILPTGQLKPERDFHGQRFLHARREQGSWSDWQVEAFEARRLGVREATGGLAQVAVVRPMGEGGGFVHEACELCFYFVLEGACELRRGGETARLGPRDAFVLPAAEEAAIMNCSEDFQFLEVALPGKISTLRCSGV